jgi:predicted DNA-binding protein YlxM (UPF0122 family)
MKLSEDEAGLDLLEHDKILKEQLDMIRSRIYLLDGADKRIMSMYLVNGISYRQIALLLGISTSSISRKIKRIIPKLTQGIFILCLKNQEQFTQAEIAIARDYFIKGLSIRKIARKRKTSFYKIRQTLAEIRQTADNI